MALSGGGVAGIVIGVILFIALLIALGVLFFWWRKKRHLPETKVENQTTTYANLEQVEFQTDHTQIDQSGYQPSIGGGESKESTCGIQVPSKAVQAPILHQPGIEPSPKRASIHVSQNVAFDITGRDPEVVKEKKRLKAERLERQAEKKKLAKEQQKLEERLETSETMEEQSGFGTEKDENILIEENKEINDDKKTLDNKEKCKLITNH